MNKEEYEAAKGLVELLVEKIERYEKEHFPIPPPTAEEAAAFRQDQMSCPHCGGSWIR